MQLLKYRKYRKTSVLKCKKTKARKTKARKTKARKTKARKTKARKTKHMKGGNTSLTGIPQTVLNELQADVYAITHPQFKLPPYVAGLNVGQPENAPYTGFGWYQN